MSHIDLSEQPIDRLTADILAVPFFEDQRPQLGPAALVDWRLNDGLTHLLLDAEVSGQRGERLLLQSNGKIPTDWLLFYGGGCYEGLSAQNLHDLVEEMVQSCLDAGYRSIALGLPPFPEVAMAAVVDAVEKGMKKAKVDTITCQVGFYPPADRNESNH